MKFTDEIGSERFTGADRIAAERATERHAKRYAELARLTGDQFGSVPSMQLARMLDCLNDRLFERGHENHYLLAEAAIRLREY